MVSQLPLRQNRGIYVRIKTQMVGRYAGMAVIPDT